MGLLGGGGADDVLLDELFFSLDLFLLLFISGFLLLVAQFSLRQVLAVVALKDSQFPMLEFKNLRSQVV